MPLKLIFSIKHIGLNRLFVLCCALWTSISANAQMGNMTGKVVYTDGQPAVNAVLLIKENGKHFITNTEGYYRVENVPYGRYTLVVNSIEAEKEEIPVHVDGPATQFNITAKRSELSLSEVVVNGLSQNKEIATQGYAVNVIDTKGIEMQSIQANELLDRSAGVRIRQSGGLGSRIEYNINGLSGNSIRIFINGTPIANYGPSFSLSSIPTSMIDRIEVYKGVVPAHLSDDALGGAINVVLKKGTGNSLGASYSVGSFNTHQANVSGGYRNDSTGFTARAAAFYNYSDNNYKVWGDMVYVTGSNGKITYLTAERFHDRYRSGGANFDIGFTDVKWADRMMVGAVISGMDKQAQHGATMETVYGRRFAEQTTLLANMVYQKNGFLVDGLDVSLTASHANLNRQVVDTSAYIFNWKGELNDFNGDGHNDKWASGAEGSSPTLEESLEDISTVRLNALYALPANNSMAVNYLGTRFNRLPDDEKRPDAERELMDTRSMGKQIWGFTFENIALKNRLKTSLFFKYYHQTLKTKDPVKKSGVLTVLDFEKETEKSGYGFATSFAVLPKWMLQVSAEKAVRLPEHSEVFGNSAENIDASYGLEPEQSNNANVGLNMGPFGFGEHRIGLNTNLFYRNTKDMIRQAVASQQAETFAFENHDVVLSKGIDAELNYRYAHKLIVTVAASNFNARFNKKYDDYGAEYIYYGDRLRNEPYFTANSNMQYNLANILQKGSKLTLYYNWAYVHQFYRDWPSLGGANKAVIPTQSIQDIGFAYAFPGYKLTVSADAKNVFDCQVFDNWALQKPGRAFYIKLNYRIY
jgi:outer membrane receptor protein involved in Fe transport